MQSTVHKHLKVVSVADSISERTVALSPTRTLTWLTQTSSLPFIHLRTTLAVEKHLAVARALRTNRLIFTQPIATEDDTRPPDHHGPVLALRLSQPPRSKNGFVCLDTVWAPNFTQRSSLLSTTTPCRRPHLQHRLAPGCLYYLTDLSDDHLLHESLSPSLARPILRSGVLL